MAEKLYLVTREDLSPGQQAVQSSHALTEFMMMFPEATKEWYMASNHLVLLSVKNEKELKALLDKAQRREILAAPFREPDRGSELTAIALEPAAKGLVRHLSLALRS